MVGRPPNFRLNRHSELEDEDKRIFGMLSASLGHFPGYVHDFL